MSAVEHKGVFTSRSVYPGAEFSYVVHIPDGCGNKKDLGLHISHDGLLMSETGALDALAKTGGTPYCVSIGIFPGVLPSGGSGDDRRLRMLNYDMFTPDYPEFVIGELIPFLTGKYGLSISPDPDLHMVSGGSSGGISAWNMAFYRPDYVRRVYMASPSFLSMGRGRELPALMRKYETLPVKVYMEYSENEPDDYFGSSLCAAMDAYRALKFAGYDVECAYYPGEGHSSRYADSETALKREAILWKGWQSEKITVKKLSPRMEKIVSPDLKWEEVDGMPDPSKSVSWRGAAERITAVSADGRRLYAADPAQACVYAYSLDNGSVGGRYRFAALHLPTDFGCPGAYDLAVGTDDRVYAATELGIQCIRSFGLIDAIIPLPGMSVPVRLYLTKGDDPYMYAETSAGVFRRRWLAAGGADGKNYSRAATSYYD
ncbi:MAG: hypothetical protein K6D94_06945 [Clostridiales bacterium]|nr:hypothetical protein [Clostridiales bacterium]